MTAFYIAWNATRTEGFITDSKADATAAKTGKGKRGRGFVEISTVADAFHKAYEDEKITIEEVFI